MQPARVRAVLSGIQLSPRQHLPGHVQAGVTENCKVLARWATQLLALPPGPTLRTWEYAPGRPDPRPAAPSLHAMGAARSESLGLGGPRLLAPVLRGPGGIAPPLRIFVVPSPSVGNAGGIRRLHPCRDQPGPGSSRNPDGTFRGQSPCACAECSTPFRGAPPKPRPACLHEPSAAATARPGGIPADIEDEIAKAWRSSMQATGVTCLTDLSAADAARRASTWRRSSSADCKRNPAPVELLDGIPCRRLDCDVMGLERAPLPAAPAGPDEDSPFSRCPACGDTMATKEYTEWTAWYARWPSLADPGVYPVQVCCNCTGLPWASCECRARGHCRSLSDYFNRDPFNQSPRPRRLRG